MYAGGVLIRLGSVMGAAAACSGPDRATAGQQTPLISKQIEFCTNCYGEKHANTV